MGSLVPSPHSLMRRNDLVNQVEFLRLVQHFWDSVTQQCSKHLHQNPLKKGTRAEIFFFTIVRELLHNDYQSHSLIGPYHFLGISPRNLTLFTRPFFVRKCTWAGRETKAWNAMHTAAAVARCCGQLLGQHWVGHLSPFVLQMGVENAPLILQGPHFWQCRQFNVM